MFRLAFVLAAALAASSQVAAKPAPPPQTQPALGLSPAAAAAVRTLLDVEVFGGWAVGVAGAPTAGVSALRVLVKERNAAAALAYVRANATMAGQLMALAGLYDVDPKAFAKALPAYAKITDKVRVWETGCMMSPDRAVADVVMSKDAIQIGGAGKPMPRWTPRHRGDWMIFDLAGGGYSAAMRERPKTP